MTSSPAPAPGLRAETPEPYDAFVSYRRKDARAVAAWLRRRLQSAKLPDEVLVKLSPNARSLHQRRPRVFVDTAYEKPSADFLTRKVYPSLDVSQRLIVVSSPAAFEPQRGRDGKEAPNWLWLEIEHFLGGASPTAPPRPIDVVLAPGAPEDRFPGRLDENPRWDWIDLRRFSRWRALGLSEELDVGFTKLLAALYDVPDELLPVLRREERRRRNRALAIAATVTTLVALVMLLLAVYALNGQVRANRATASAEASSTESRRQRSDALAAAAGRARAAGDPLSSIRLLAEAQRNAITPSVTAHQLATGEPPIVFGRTLLDGDAGAWAITFRPQSRQLAVGSYTGEVRLIDTSEVTPKIVDVAPSTGVPVVDIDFSSDGRTVFALMRSPADAAWNPGPDVSAKSAIRAIQLGDDGHTNSESSIEPGDGEPHFLSLATAGAAELLIGTERDVRLRLDDGSTIILPDTEPLQGASVTVSPDGHWAAASTIHGKVRVWDLSRRVLHRSFTVPRPEGTFEYDSFPLAFSPSSDQVAFGSFDGSVHVWRFAGDEPVNRFVAGELAVSGIAWGPDGRTVVAGTYDGFTTVLDAATGAPQSRLSTTWPGLRSGALRLALSDDGERLVTTEAVPASSGDHPGRWLFGTVRLWSIPPPVAGADELGGLAFDDAGRLSTWRQADALELRREGDAMHSRCVAGRAWSPIVEGQRRRLGISHLKASISESSDARGEVAVSVGPTGTRVVGASALDPSGTHLGVLVARSDANGLLAEPRFVLCRPGTDVPALDVALPSSGVTSLGPLLFDAKGEQAIALLGEAGGTTIVRVAMAQRSSEKVTQWEDHDVSSAAISPDDYLALGDTNGNVALVDLSSRALTESKAWLFGAPAQVAFDGSGRVLAMAAQAQLRLYEVRNGAFGTERRASVPLGFKPTAIAFTALGSVLVVGEQRGTLSFWNTTTLTEITRVHAHDGPVLALRVSPDGARMASLAPGRVRIGGGFIPSSVDLAERMTRLDVRGGDTGPLDATREMAVTSQWPVTAWRSEPDPAAAEFWRLVRSGGIRPVRADGWWQWLRWSGSVAISEPLRAWQARNRQHALAASAPTLVGAP